MPDRKTRLALTVLAVLLPGPWTPIIVLAYVLARDDESRRTTTENRAATGFRPPAYDPYACTPITPAPRHP